MTAYATSGSAKYSSEAAHHWRTSCCAVATVFRVRREAVEAERVGQRRLERPEIRLAVHKADRETAWRAPGQFDEPRGPGGVRTAAECDMIAAMLMPPTITGRFIEYTTLGALKVLNVFA